MALVKYTSGVPVQQGRRRGATLETWIAAAILGHPGKLVVGELARHELIPVGACGFLLRAKAGAGFRAFDRRDQIVNQCSRVHCCFLELEFLPAERLLMRCGTFCTELRRYGTSKSFPPPAISRCGPAGSKRSLLHSAPAVSWSALCTDLVRRRRASHPSRCGLRASGS